MTSPHADQIGTQSPPHADLVPPLADAERRHANKRGVRPANPNCSDERPFGITAPVDGDYAFMPNHDFVKLWLIEPVTGGTASALTHCQAPPREQALEQTLKEHAYRRANTGPKVEYELQLAVAPRFDAEAAEEPVTHFVLSVVSPLIPARKCVCVAEQHHERRIDILDRTNNAVRHAEGHCVIVGERRPGQTCLILETFYSGSSISG